MFRSRCTSTSQMGPLLRGKPKPASDTLERKQFHLCLIGPGDCGKATLFKQWSSNCTTYSPREKQEIKYDIYNYLVLLVIKVYEVYKYNECDNDDGTESSSSSSLSQEYHQLCEELTIMFETQDVREFYTDDIHSRIQSLVECTVFQQAIKQYFHRVHCPDGLRYFMNNMERLQPSSYEPTFHDILNVRRKSAGILEKSFEYKENLIKLTLTAGQRGERKKWSSVMESKYFHFCDNECILTELIIANTTLAFVVSTSDYDQTCYEDDTKNRTLEALDVFEEYISYEQFLGKPVFLIMNKTDLFKSKYNESELSQCFPQFSLSDNPSADDGMKYLQQEYQKRFDSRRKDSNNLIIYQTTATEHYSKEVLVQILHQLSPERFELTRTRKELSPTRKRSNARLMYPSTPTAM
jgi:guanine nucleotide-binding protein G(i) subunit alpha